MMVLEKPWTLRRHREAVRLLTYGKRLPEAIYFRDGEEFPVPPELRAFLNQVREKVGAGPEFNIVKLGAARLRVSFLNYPDFFSDPHPVLAQSVTVDLAAGTVRRTEYGGRANPPILHRKEAFLPPGHEEIPRFSALTQSEEAEGLYQDPSAIGFRVNWDQLLASKGLSYQGHRLVRASGAGEVRSSQGAGPARRIERHKTAISRTGFSKPVKTLIDYGLLGREDLFFDFGCGLGDDARGLEELGYRVAAWDPHFRPGGERPVADVVNLGFVVNVIEDPAERVETLREAWAKTTRLLVVSTLMTGRESYYGRVEPFGDGILTIRNTFQKHYEPAEFHSFLEDALDAEAVPVEPGLCCVFRRWEDQQDFVAGRTKRAIDWEQISQRLRGLRDRAPRLTLYERHAELLDDYWHALLEFGRPPRPGEYPRYEEIRRACGSGNQAARLFAQRYGEDPLAEARERRKEDLLVYLSGGEFQKRRIGFQRLSSRLRADVKAFFGNYASACDEARTLLFTAGAPEELELAIKELEFGWLDSTEGHFTVHRSLLDRLPALLRIYVECGARLYGDPRQADLIKIHLRSKKLTFLHYEDFESPLPVLETRIKIDLRRLFVHVIDHSGGPEHQLLFFKERFLDPGDPVYPKCQAYSKRLRKLGIHEGLLASNDRHAPSQEAFEVFLARAGLTKGLARRAGGA